MTDTTQGADAPSDAALFQEATSSGMTLADFENPKLGDDLPAEKPAEKPATPPADKPIDKTAEQPKPENEPSVPAGRLREEAERARRAERERDELIARLTALQKPPPEQKKRPDLFEDPEAFVRSIVEPWQQQQEQQRIRERENLSKDWATQRFGQETVDQAGQALEHFMLRLNDPYAISSYNQAMASHDPWGVIVNWFQRTKTISEVGPDLNAFRQRERQAALQDPEFLKAAIEHARGQARSNGSFTNQSVKPAVPNLPSLGDVGASGGDAQVTQPSELELFRAATTAKRR